MILIWYTIKKCIESAVVSRTCVHVCPYVCVCVPLSVSACLCVSVPVPVVVCIIGLNEASLCIHSPGMHITLTVYYVTADYCQ